MDRPELLSIKIKICDRIYPIKVHPADETFVRKAGLVLDERIRTYQKKFGIQDQQDLLAMVSFDCLVEELKLQSTNSKRSAACIQQLATWSSQIEEILEEASTVQET
jgi:cell division protein ZapA